MFWKYHNEGVLKKYKPRLQVGSLDSKKPAAAPAPAPAPKPAPKPAPAPAKAAAPAAAAAAASAPAEALEPFGSLIPFADPNWYHSVSCDPSPAHRSRLPLLPLNLPLLQG